MWRTFLFSIQVKHNTNKNELHGLTKYTLRSWMVSWNVYFVLHEEVSWLENYFWKQILSSAGFNIVIREFQPINYIKLHHTYCSYTIETNITYNINVIRRGSGRRGRVRGISYVLWRHNKKYTRSYNSTTAKYYVCKQLRRFGFDITISIPSDKFNSWIEQIINYI